MAKATLIREAEHLHNAKLVEEANTGLDALARAFKILEAYYGKAAKNTERTVEKNTGKTTAGFDKQYAGNQAGGAGVIGMMDVVKTDLKRQISRAKSDEVEAVDRYDEYKRVTNVAIAEKKVVHDQQTEAMATAKEETTNAKSALDTAQTSLDNALQSIDSENESAECGRKGVSFEAREAARKAEIDALKGALAVLEKSSVR